MSNRAQLFKLRPTDGVDVDSRIPVIPAWDTGDHFVIWCAYCSVWHFHSREDGERHSHCTTTGSPYKTTGYVLRCVGAAPLKIRQDLARMGRRSGRRPLRLHRVGGSSR